MRCPRWVTLFLLLLLPVLMAVALVGAGVALREWRLANLAPTDVPPLPFNADGWRSGSAIRRIAMARNLTAADRLLGRSRAQIVAQLGTPLPGATDRRLEWLLGERESPASMMFPYREHLVVALDEWGVCERAFILNKD